ncbi:bifunctional chorismate-binding protein/class IV aminotransferase [Wielerella bovis]|uniref:bifunctional chorismate-binding protein/class IV aminotransferase n=1 Tax=Wielerella bovis TaxID=2917790 RepID=UPI0020198D11|nr:bifunctional chorismate-binding protein/class IV aminotransferase [Wielerella bovis]ULJ66872.1 chorismate-binding protein [Wielerella bovis]
MSPFVLFDDARQAHAFVLQDFVYQDELNAEQLPQLDTHLQRAWANGLYCALFADYELGLPLQKLPASHTGSLKILWFKTRSIVANVDDWLTQHASTQPAGISTAQLNVSQAEYCQHIAQIHAAIQRGDTYQINHTLRLNMQTYGDPMRLYQRLRQNVPYAALARQPENIWTLCFSPELFLRIESTGTIITEPMKGTAPILHDGHDAERAQILQNDPKNRAENTMIVDLLRNDLGKIAHIGGVSVPEPFAVNAFGSVWQMTSRVEARVPRETTVARIFQAAFPCGSITGAPKRKSMEIIAQLEDTPRGLYTGSIGFLQPETDSELGFSGCLNVVIRTLQLSPRHDGTFDGTYGVGSGIVIDSQAVDEYAECGWKARFICELRPECGLFETMRGEQGAIAWLPEHLARLAQSAHALNIPFDAAAAENCVRAVLPNMAADKVYRIKLSLSPQGSLNAEYAPLMPLSGQQRIRISDTILPRHDSLRRHKTTHRTMLDATWQTAEQHGAFDALLFNEDGFLLEGGRSSVMILLDNQWLTPAADLDILPSIALAKSSLKPKAAYITREMLYRADKICVGNALRGWIEVLLDAS